MEKAIVDYGNQKHLINIELTQGKERAYELKNYLDGQKSGELCVNLVEKILSSYAKSLAMLKSSTMRWGEPKETSQCFTSDSARSDISDQSQQCVQKKRNALPEWSTPDRVFTGTGHDDGYSWRKYGQKDILGAVFPRAYYRCTHRHTQGCLATKQVQKCDNDESVFEIIYKGRHTCNQTTQSAPTCVSIDKESKKQKKEAHMEKKTSLFNSEPSLKTDQKDDTSRVARFPSFSFPSTPIETTNVENNLFSNSLWETFSSSYISQETSDSNYLSLQHSESDSTKILSLPTSVTNSPAGDFDFSLDQVELDPDFPFDLVEYFH